MVLCVLYAATLHDATIQGNDWYDSLIIHSNIMIIPLNQFNRNWFYDSQQSNYHIFATTSQIS